MLQTTLPWWRKSRQTKLTNPLLAGFFMAVAFLVGCGGADAGSPCAVPYEVVVTRGWAGDVQQYHKATSASPYVLQASGADAMAAVLPCHGYGTQWFHFKTWGEGFFEPAHGLPANGNHLAALTRGTFNMAIPQYIARGVILHRDFGVAGERFHRNDAINASNVLQCASWFNGGSCVPGVFYAPHAVTASDAVFHWQMESSPTHTAYNLFSTETGRNAVGVWAEGYDHVSLSGTSLGLAVLCDAGCPGPFIARFFDIQAGWK
ncbi:hypothetical protein [Acidovorax sp. NB1]|uniref:hypothetical protein n=1 Tax=Acidovorax sp. NB1 TaxID=1943571 RepID=UPI0010F6CE1A|nr:hypothetical protein [Acidovorax sp. NB1]